jgi:hypothetical protein
MSRYAWNPRDGWDPSPFSYNVFLSYTTREEEVKEVLPIIQSYREELIKVGFTKHCFLDRVNWDRLRRTTPD